MRLVRRILVMVTGYVCAALVGSFVLLAIASMFDRSQNGLQSPQEFMLYAGLIAFGVATIALPATLPVIVFAELNPRSNRSACLLGGLLLGIVMGCMLNWNGFRLGPMVVSILASLCGAMTYWLISCFAFPPTRTQSGTNPILESHIA
jgi:hypothetical protein